jgi:hypothetical protein
MLISKFQKKKQRLRKKVSNSVRKIHETIQKIIKKRYHKNERKKRLSDVITFIN